MPWFANGLVAEVYGSGNAPEKVVSALRRRARLFPVVAASQAHGKIDLTAYAAGRSALEAGVLPSGGLSPLTASKRLSYLLAHKREIKDFAKKSKVNSRRLIATLFLSGADFQSIKIKQAHSDILQTPIIPDDLLVQIPFQDALKRAVKAIRKTSAYSKPQKSFS